MALALALDELAARLTGTEPDGAAPEAWAYALREAVALARPDVLICGWGGAAQTAALAAIADGAEDVVDALYDAPPLAEAPPVAHALEVVRTLAALYPGAPRLAAVVRGPCSAAAALGADQEAAEVAADLLAALAGAYGEAGAELVLVVEDLAPADERAHSPVVRALEHQRLDAVLLAPAGGGPAGHARCGEPWSLGGAAPDVAVVDPALWIAGDDAFAAGRAAIAGTPGLVVVAGQLPGDLALERLA